MCRETAYTVWRAEKTQKANFFVQTEKQTFWRFSAAKRPTAVTFLHAELEQKLV